MDIQQKIRISARCTLLEVPYVEVLLYIMGPDKKWTNCINVQCIAARIRMISPLGKSTFTPIAYQLRLQWLKGVGSSISNYTIFQIFFFDQDSLKVLYLFIYIDLNRNKRDPKKTFNHTTP